MTTVTKLKEARALIERGWCQGADAMTASGRSVFPEHGGAERWCAGGACAAAAKDREIERPIFRTMLDSLLRAIPEHRPMTVSFWNDEPGRTQAEVLALFDRAIAAEEAKEKA